MEITLELVSLFKRKEVKGIMAAIVAEHNEELAKEITEAGRLTNALIDRTIGKLVGLKEYDPIEEKEKFDEIDANRSVDAIEMDGVFEEPLPEFAEAAVEEHNELAAQLEDLKGLIEAGKYKKAKKLFKAMNFKGSEADKLKKQIKELKETK